MKFGTLHQILNPVTVTSPKIEIFKIQDGGGRHLENRFLGHKSSTDYPISAKFCMTKQSGSRQGLRVEKCKFLESNMADGRDFENRKIAVSQWKVVRFWWNLVHYIRYWTRLRSHDQKLKFLKFKMAAAAILKIAFLAINHWPIVRFQQNLVWGSRTAGRQTLHDKNCTFLNSNMADGRHFENR